MYATHFFDKRDPTEFQLMRWYEKDTGIVGIVED
jgi:hypothetical protein